MPRVLIVFGTTNGQTTRVARRMAEVLALSGLEVEVVDSAHPPEGFAAMSIGGFDAALVLGSVRMGKHPEALVEFVRLHRKELDAIPNAFVSVSLSAARGEKPAARREVAKTFQSFATRTGWRAAEQVPVAGALPYSKYTFRIRLLLKFINWMLDGDTDTSRDYEYTDWTAVADFARRFGGAIVQAPAARTGASAQPEMRPR